MTWETRRVDGRRVRCAARCDELGCENETTVTVSGGAGEAKKIMRKDWGWVLCPRVRGAVAYCSTHRKVPNMSTNDVPGHRAENADQLAMGSWAEHEDGSLIFVQSVENKRVIYMLFDMRRMPPRRWQGAMDETKFKQHFSWDPKKAKKDPTHFKWTWHDKKPFPWDNVMEEIDEEPLVQTEDEIKSAAERVAEALGLRAEAVRRADIEHQAEQVRPGTAAGTEIMQRLRRALDAFFEEPR